MYQAPRGCLSARSLSPGEPMMKEAPIPEVLHLKSEEMTFAQMFPEAGGYASRCTLITPEISATLGATAHTYDGCSIEWQAHYDHVMVVLAGTLRILTGENFSRVIEAGFADIIWLTEGTRLRYEGDKAKVFSAIYPVDWRARGEMVTTDTTTEMLHLR